jgi:uncharacterized repeat protein (TIGR03809 family)
MTQRIDVARGRDVLARWCSLAEQRLDYLTELFETGRWRRFHSEIAFLENIREAKSAVELWRDLSTREASLDANTVDRAWLAAANATLPRKELPHKPPPRDQAPRVAAPPLRFSADLPRAETPSVAEVDQPAFEPDLPALELALDIISQPPLEAPSIEARYPLLRNAL